MLVIHKPDRAINNEHRRYHCYALGRAAEACPTPTALLCRGQLFQHLVGDLKIGEDILHVVVIF